MRSWSPTPHGPVLIPLVRRLAISLTVIALLSASLVWWSPPALGRTPTLHVEVVATAGSQVLASGSGFAAHERIQLRWNGSEAGMPTTQADATGHFIVAVMVPLDARAESHTLTAAPHGSASPDVTAHTAIQVVVIPDEITVVTPATTDETVQEEPTAASDHNIDVLEVPSPLPMATTTPTEHAVSLGADSASAASTVSEAATAPTHAPSHAPAPTAVPTRAPAAHHPVNPVSCTGYPEPRTFLEIHTWWEGPPLAKGNIAHLHVGSCVPVGQTVSGHVNFDVRIVMHDNPGHLFRYETALFTDNAGEGNLDSVGMNQTCAGTCEYWVRTTVDTTRANDGWHELRFKARVEHSNGDVQLTSSGWPIQTQNGNADGGGREASGGIVGRGWYTDRGYQNPVLQSIADVLPGARVSGVWTPTVRLDAGSGGSEPTFSAAYIGPDFHAHDEDSSGGGRVLGQWNSAFRGKLAIDTRGLPNGTHVLVLRVDSRGDGERLVALTYVPFTVAN